MKKILIKMLIFVFIFSWITPVFALQQSKEDLKQLEKQLLEKNQIESKREILIKYKDRSSKGKRFNDSISSNLEKRKDLGSSIEKLKFKQGTNMDAIISELKKDPSVEFVQLNQFRHSYTPEEPSIAANVPLTVYQQETVGPSVYQEPTVIEYTYDSQLIKDKTKNIDTALGKPPLNTGLPLKARGLITKSINQSETKNAMSLGDIYEVEPNDTDSDANNIALDYNVWGAFDSQYDTDCYRLVVPQAGNLNILGVAGQYGQYFTLGLYDNYGNDLDWTSTYYDPEGSSFQATTVYVTPGTYYIDGITWDDNTLDNTPFMVGQTYLFNAYMDSPSTGVPVQGIFLNKTETRIAKGKTETLVPTITPSNATNPTVSWQSSNTNVVTVNASTGTVSAVQPGSSIITATTSDGGYTASCLVIVPKVVTNPNVVNDPLYFTQWGLEAIDAISGWGNIQSTKKTVKVAVIDSGIDLQHEDLIDRIAPNGYNFILDNNDIYDINGHGTAVSGVIGAGTNNFKGIAGVTGAFDIKILPLQASYYDGSMSVSDEVDAINYAINQGVDVINISSGGFSSDPIENTAIQDAISRGIVVVCSAGNENSNSYSFPASYDNVISVGSIAPSGTISTFSNHNDKVDVVAPGEDIYLTIPENGYEYESGTSFSGPMVAGTAALLKAMEPSLSSQKITDILTQTAEDRGTTGKDNYYGYGLVSVGRAVTRVDDLLAVSSDKTDLVLGYASGDNANNVTKNLILPTTGSNGTTISWTSSNPSILSTNGNVTRPSSTSINIPVTLTATISKGGELDTKQFMVTVLTNDVTPPALSNVSTGPITVGENITTTSNEEGTLYLVSKATASTKEAIEAAGNTVNGSKASCTAGVPATLMTDEFDSGIYAVYAIDTAGNISIPSADITINSLDLTGVSINVASGQITGTRSDMEYSLNSTNGLTGTWIACSDTNTAVTFEEGTIYVRASKKHSNYRLVQTLTIAQAPDVSGVSYNVGQGTINGTGDGYQYKIGNGSWVDINTAGATNIAFVPGELKFRVKATPTALPSAEAKKGDISSPMNAPMLEYDDVANTISGLDSTYEVMLDSGPWTSGENPVNLTGAHIVQIREKATSTTFPSQVQTINFTTNLDLSGAEVNVLAGVISGTATNMEYSLNSTTGLDGTWNPCSTGNTVTVFVPGKVYVRSTEQPRNFRLITTVDMAEVPDVSGVVYNVETSTISGVLDTWQYKIGGGTWVDIASNGTINGILFTAGPVDFRVKKTNTTLASDPVTKGTIPLNAPAPDLVYDDVYNSITGLDSSYEYKIGTGAWTAGDVAGDFSGAKTVQIRGKATQNTLQSLIQTINFIANDDANLTGITISNVALTPPFSPNVLNYTSSVSNSISSVTVTPTKPAIGTTIWVNGSTILSGTVSSAIDLKVGTNIVNIAVYAQDSITSKIYTVTINRSGGSGGGGGSYVPSSTPASIINSGDIKTDGDRALNDSLGKTGKASISLVNDSDSLTQITPNIVKSLSTNHKVLTIENKGVTIEFAAESLITPEVTSILNDPSSKLEVGAKFVSTSEQEKIIENAKIGQSTGLFLIGGKIIDLTAQVVGKNSTEKIKIFSEPVAVKIDLSGITLSEADIANLTGIRYEKNSDGSIKPVKLGGTYDPKTKIFTFYTDKFSQYGVLRASKITITSLKIGDKKISVNGVMRDIDVPPTINNNRTMVPIRFVAESLGAKVDWISNTGTVVITLDGKTLTMKIGEISPGLDTPPVLSGNRTLVPIRYVSEALGANVLWFKSTQSIQIVK